MTHHIKSVTLNVPYTIHYPQAVPQTEPSPQARAAAPVARRHTEIVRDLDSDRMDKPQPRLVPTMIGNDIYFMPEPEPIDFEPVRKFFAWLFGAG